jgi:hypothetical protein
MSQSSSRLSRGCIIAALALVVGGCNSVAPVHPNNNGGRHDMSMSAPPPPDLSPPADLTTCVNLQCAIPQCSGGTTSLSGIVYDPAGKTPLYNVAVYIPNAPLGDIPDGIDTTTCSSCVAPLSGSPIAVALTDAKGAFTLKGVPAGSNIPLVMQTGKFRRQITLPTVTACMSNAVGQKDAMGAEMLTRLPRNQKEGHLPLIAITTGGCEGLECVVRTFGFDDAEFTTSTGTGRIHLYTGNLGGKAAGSTADSTEAYKFWGSTNIYKYDMILNSCECSDYPRDTFGPAYTNMKTYLDHGGRLFTSDFQYNWFTDANAPAEWKTAAKWMPSQTAPVYSTPYYVETSFDKGNALNQWLQNVFAGNSPPPTGQITLNELYYNVAGVMPGTTRWIYDTSDGKTATVDATNYTTKYLSFDTPFSSSSDMSTTVQCGRAVFADIHVSHSVVSTTFPTGCEALTKDQQVTAFEFLFFDLGSCDMPTVLPPPITSPRRPPL